MNYVGCISFLLFSLVFTGINLADGSAAAPVYQYPASCISLVLSSTNLDSHLSSAFKENSSLSVNRVIVENESPLSLLPAFAQLEDCHRISSQKTINQNQRVDPISESGEVDDVDVWVTDLTGVRLNYLALHAQVKGAVLISTAEKLRLQLQPLMPRHTAGLTNDISSTSSVSPSVIWTGVRPYKDNSSLSSILCLLSRVHQLIATENELNYDIDILLLVDSDFISAAEGFAVEMKKYLNLLISVKTTMQSNRGQQQGRVNPFDLQNVIHIALNLSDPEDVSKQLTSLQPYSHKINCVLVYSKNPSRIFDAFLKHNFLTLLASQLWILPYSVSSQFCSKESPYNPRWPPKLVIQCILGWYGPEKVVELLPHIINSSLHQVRDQMNNEPVDGYQNILQRTASTLRGNMDRVYKTELTDSGVNGEWFDFKMNSHIERQLKSVLQISPYPSPATIWGNLGEFACTVKGWEGYGCKTQETNQNKVRVLGVYNPPYWLESDYSEKEGCLGLAYQARVFSQLEHIADNRNDLAQIRCVDGFGLELLRKLASDVGFKYTVVVLNNTQFRVRQNWSHVAQLVQYKNIGIVIGQIPASVDLMKRVSFSTPYRYDSLCITVQKRFQGATIDSFLRPLNVFMFVSIGISVNIVAVSITCLEWNSPFGLSPRGRNRDKVFSLPSGLTLCWSILLGHTVDTSTPKSWSARWLMNMWAALCVYFLASYTAKLAVYMIGRTTYVELSDINDPKILSGEVKLGTLSGSYAHEHLVTFYDFHTELTSDQEHHDKSDHDGKVKELRLYNNLSHALLSLQKGEIDGIVFQRGVMEHIVSSNFNCRLYIVGNPFGHLQYSIMFAKDDLESNTWFNRYLGIYHSNMQIEDMLDKWRRGAKCDSQMLTEPKLHVDHCKGVFLMLLLGIVLGMVGNVAEQMLARFVRRYQNNEKIVALLRPLSQRVYKCVQSDGFYMPGLGSIATSFSGFWTRAKESDEEVEANDTRKYPHPSLSGSAKIRQKRNQRPSNQVVIANTNTTKPSTFVSNRMFMAALKKQKVDRTISATESTCIQNSAVQSPLMPDCHTRKLSHISGASSELPTIYPVEDGNEDCERRSSLL